MDAPRNFTLFQDSKAINVVAGSKLMLLAAWQASESRDDMLGQGIVTLLRKPADQEDGGLVSQWTILPGFGR